MVGGELLTGPTLAALITKMVQALNARDIPSVGSILEFFNKEVHVHLRQSIGIWKQLRCGAGRQACVTCQLYLALACAQLLYQCRDAYAKQMEGLILPVDTEKLEAWHTRAAAAAYAQFDRDKFGTEVVSLSGTLRDALKAAIEKEHRCHATPFINESYGSGTASCCVAQVRFCTAQYLILSQRAPF